MAAGDSLYSRVCQPASPPRGYDGLDFLARGGTVRTGVRRRGTGQRRAIDTYRYAQSRPRRDAEKALGVNWCERTTPDDKGHVLYHNRLATSQALDEHPVPEVAAAGRCRWKLENENNHPLKTQGYPFEHHYGPGQHPLSSLLASLISLAFRVHTVLEWMDGPYRLLRQKLPSRQRLFSDIRTLTRYLRFASWADLRTFLWQSFKPPPRPLETG